MYTTTDRITSDRCTEYLYNKVVKIKSLCATLSKESRESYYIGIEVVTLVFWGRNLKF